MSNVIFFIVGVTFGIVVMCIAGAAKELSELEEAMEIFNEGFNKGVEHEQKQHEVVKELISIAESKNGGEKDE